MLPFGFVSAEGMQVVDQLYSAYGEGSPGGNGPDQGRVQDEGNEYLTAHFPKLSYINSVTAKGGAMHKLRKRQKAQELRE